MRRDCWRARDGPSYGIAEQLMQRISTTFERIAAMRQIIPTQSAQRCATPGRRKTIAASVMLVALLVSGCNLPGGGPSSADRVALIEDTRDRELRLAAAARNSGQPETALARRGTQIAPGNKEKCADK